MTSRNSLAGIQRCCCAALIFLLAIAPSIGLGQANAPAATLTPLPPEAQAAMKKGIIAAKQQEWEIAIRSFQEARKTAPDSPEVFYNLGLAESKIPGRELRAIAWFGAYLSATANAPNASAVKDKIAELQIKNEGNTSRLIKSVQDAANQTSGDAKDLNLVYVAMLWAEAGDISVALKAAALMQHRKSQAQKEIAIAQTKAGDIAGAQMTADLIQEPGQISGAQLFIAEAQAKSGDITGALKTADLIQDAHSKSLAQSALAEAQAKSGDITGAQKTADLVRDEFTGAKSTAQRAIAEAQAKAGIANAPKSIRQSTSDTQPPIQPPITVSDLLDKLDNSFRYSACPLNKESFLNLAGYLKSLPPSDDPQKVFESLRITAQEIVTAQNVIAGMLKQQAGK